MALERSWLAVSQLFTADGTVQGIITVADVQGFYVGQTVLITSNAQPSISLIVKRVDGTTILHVGQPGDINNRTPVSAYLVADSAKVSASEQLKPRVKKEDQDQASFELQPIIARRVLLVDPYGAPYGPGNPIPAIFDGTLQVGEVEVKGTNGNFLEPNVDGSINTVNTADSARTPSIFNVTVPLSATEVSQALPDNTKRFSIQVRGGTAQLQFAFTSGQSGTNFILVPRGASYEATNLLTTGLTIYFQANKPGQLVEILSWA